MPDPSGGEARPRGSTGDGDARPLPPAGGAVAVAGLGHSTLSPGVTWGALAGHQPDIGADGAPGQPVPVADLDGQPERVNVAMPRIQPNRCTIGVNSLSAAIGVIALSSRGAPVRQASIAS